MLDEAQIIESFARKLAAQIHDVNQSESFWMPYTDVAAALIAALPELGYVRSDLKPPLPEGRGFLDELLA